MVFERPGGLTAADKQAISGYRRRAEDVANVYSAAVTAPSYSTDGTAAQVVVPVASSDGEEIQDAVAAIRDAVDGPAGRADRAGRRAGRHPRRLHHRVRGHRRHPAGRRARWWSW